MLKKLPEVGQRVIAGETSLDVTEGKSYEVVKIDPDFGEFCIVDNTGRKIWLDDSHDFTLEETVLTSEETLFQVGDKVWCLLFGEGEVVTVASECYGYPVEAHFESGEEHNYTIDGKYYSDQNRTLYFSEPKIEAALTRPFKSKLVGKTVQLVSKDWQILGVVQNETSTKIDLGYDGEFEKSKLTGIYELSSENLL